MADVPQAEPFGTPEWVISWLDAFWQDRPIRFLFAREGERLVGVAPLLVDDRGTYCCRGALALPVDAIGWRGEILHAEDDGAVVDAMLAHLGRAGRIRLTLPRVSADSATVRSLRSVAEQRRLWTIQREDHRTPIIRLPASAEEYLQSRSRHVRHELRRKQKRLEKAGRITVTIADAPEDMDRIFEDVKAVESRSWKGAAETSFLDAPFAEQFYRGLFAKTAAECWARIYVMYLDEKPIGHLFGFVFRRRYFAVNSSFDASLRSFSPGSVLILRGIEDACAQGLEVFDFMGSEYRWKNELATDTREHLNMCVFSHAMGTCGVNWIMDGHVKPVVRRTLPAVLRVRRKLSARREGRPPQAKAGDVDDQGNGSS